MDSSTWFKCKNLLEWLRRQIKTTPSLQIIIWSLSYAETPTFNMRPVESPHQKQTPTTTVPAIAIICIIRSQVCSAFIVTGGNTITPWLKPQLNIRFPSVSITNNNYNYCGHWYQQYVKLQLPLDITETTNIKHVTHFTTFWIDSTVCRARKPLEKEYKRITRSKLKILRQNAVPQYYT